MLTKLPEVMHKQITQLGFTAGGLVAEVTLSPYVSWSTCHPYHDETQHYNTNSGTTMVVEALNSMCNSREIVE